MSHGGTEDTENFIAVPPFPPLLRVTTCSSCAETDLPDLVSCTRDCGRGTTDYEILLVFVGRSFCRAHRRPGFHQAVENARLRVRGQAVDRGRQFRAVAVSLDRKPSEALALLDGFGNFDEMSVGSNWVDDSAIRSVWREMPGEPTVPQLGGLSDTWRWARRCRSGRSAC